MPGASSDRPTSGHPTERATHHAERHETKLTPHRHFYPRAQLRHTSGNGTVERQCPALESPARTRRLRPARPSVQNAMRHPVTSAPTVCGIAAGRAPRQNRHAASYASVPGPLRVVPLAARRSPPPPTAFLGRRATGSKYPCPRTLAVCGRDFDEGARDAAESNDLGLVTDRGRRGKTSAASGPVCAHSVSTVASSTSTTEPAGFAGSFRPAGGRTARTARPAPCSSACRPCSTISPCRAPGSGRRGGSSRAGGR